MTSPQPANDTAASAPSTRAPAPRAGRPVRKIAAGGALAFLVAGAVLAGGAQWTAHEVRGALTGMGIDVAGVSVDPVTGIVTLAGLAATQDGVRIRIGSIESTGGFALTSPAEAASPVTLTDIEIISKSVTLRIPRIEVAGDNVSEAQLRAIFDKSSKVPLGKRLSEISISRATIPELILAQKTDNAETRSTWSQVTISDLNNGVAGSVTSNGATFSTKAAGVSSTGSAGVSKMENVNLALIARLYTEAAVTDADRLPQPAYAAFSANDIAVKSDDANFTIKSVTGKDLTARLLKAPLLDIMAELDQVKDPADLEPKARSAYYNNVAELLEAFGFGEATVTGVSFDVPAANADEDSEDDADAGKGPDTKADQKSWTKNQDSKEAAKAERVRGEIASLRFNPTPVSGGLTMSGLKVAPAQGDEITLNEARIGGFGLGNVAKIMRDQALAAANGKESDAFASLGGFTGDFNLSNLSVNVSSEERPGDRIKFTLQGYSGAYKDPVDGIPTNIQSRLEHLVIDVPDIKAKAAPKAGADDEEAEESSFDDSIRQLRAMGYDKLDLSAAIEGKWDAATKELRLGDVSFSGVNVGSLKLTGLLGNVSKELFATDTDRAQEVLMAARLKNLSLSVTDSGFAQRFAALNAKDQGSDPVAVRTGWAALAQLLLPSMIGTSQGAASLTSALGDFIRKSGSLDITISSKKPDGDTISDIVMSAASGNPDKLFEELDFKAVAK